MVVKSASQRQVATAYLRPEQTAYRWSSTKRQGERAKGSKRACGGGGGGGRERSRKRRKGSEERSYEVQADNKQAVG
jgi:hypothetical protein